MEQPGTEEWRALLKDVELGPPKAKLDALGRLAAGAASLDNVQDVVTRILLQAPEQSPLRFFAATTLARLGDSRDLVVDALVPYCGATAFDEGEGLLYFPWLTDKATYFIEPLGGLGTVMRSSTQLATLEALSHMRANERASETLARILQVLEDPTWRVFTIYALGAHGGSTAREHVEYHTQRFADQLQGEAAQVAKDNLGQKTLLEIAALHRARGKGGKKSGCFIATAAFESEQAAEVLVLRALRDKHLVCTAAGRALVRAYTRLSPPIAYVLARSVLLRILVRALILRPLVRAVATIGDFSVERLREQDLPSRPIH